MYIMLNCRAPEQAVVPYSEHERDPDEPVVDFERTVLDFYNSDLHLEILKDRLVNQTFMKMKNVAIGGSSILKWWKHCRTIQTSDDTCETVEGINQTMSEPQLSSK